MKLPDLTKRCAIAAFFAVGVAVNAVGIYPGQWAGPSIDAGPGGSAQQVDVEIKERKVDVTGFQWEAEVTSRVYSNYASNPWVQAGGLGYTFEYTLSNVGGGAFGESGLGILSATFTENVGELNIGYRLPDGIGYMGAYMPDTGKGVTWVWAFGGLSKGQSSAIIVVHTPYKAYVRNAALVVGTGSGQAFEAWVPAVPEPSTYASLFALGLTGFAAYRRLRA